VGRQRRPPPGEDAGAEGGDAEGEGLEEEDEEEKEEEEEGEVVEEEEDNEDGGDAAGHGQPRCGPSESVVVARGHDPTRQLNRF